MRKTSGYLLFIFMKKDKRKDKKESALKEVKDVKEERRKNILKSTVMSVIFFLLGAVALLSSLMLEGKWEKLSSLL